MTHTNNILRKNFSKDLDFNWKGRVRRLGFGKARSSLGTLCPKNGYPAEQEGKIPSKVLKTTFCFGFKKYSHYLCPINNKSIN